jgi:FlaA1/EpsC-like NDP-sugar epimerase
MGEPVRIADLALRMVHLTGQEVKSPEKPHGTVEIKYVGLRPGEKLYEELLIGSNVTGTEHPLIMRAQEAEYDWVHLKPMLDRVDQACKAFDYAALRLLLQRVVIEYSPSSEIVDNLWLHRPTDTAQDVQAG